MNLKNKKMPLEFVKKVKDIIQEKESIEGEVKHSQEDGKELWFQNTILPIYDDSGSKLGEVVVRYDITQKKELEKLSITDALTDIYNRRHFNQILTKEIDKAEQNKTLLSFMILDIDYFKKYNDSYGHQAGDKTLVAVASALKSYSIQNSGYTFRLGGEEFGILFSGFDREASLKYAQNIIKNIELLNIPHSNSLVAKYVTVSIGLICVDFSVESVDENGFYTMADDALYKAKENGRNRVVIHEENDFEFF